MGPISGMCCGRWGCIPAAGNCDGAGVVVEVGPATGHVGDRVMGYWGWWVRRRWWMRGWKTKVPAGWSLVEAAAVPVAF